MSTKPEAGSPDELMWLRGYEEARNHFLAENARLREALRFTLNAAENLYKPDAPLSRGLDPTFYHTLSYEGDLKLIEKTKRARAALEEK